MIKKPKKKSKLTPGRIAQIKQFEACSGMTLAERAKHWRGKAQFYQGMYEILARKIRRAEKRMGIKLLEIRNSRGEIPYEKV